MKLTESAVSQRFEAERPWRIAAATAVMTDRPARGGLGAGHSVFAQITLQMNCQIWLRLTGDHYDSGSVEDLLEKPLHDVPSL